MLYKIDEKYCSIIINTKILEAASKLLHRSINSMISHITPSFQLSFCSLSQPICNHKLFQYYPQVRSQSFKDRGINFSYICHTIICQLDPYYTRLIACLTQRKKMVKEISISTFFQKESRELSWSKQQIVLLVLLLRL